MEVRSDHGVMSGREQFNVGLQKNPVQSQPSMQSMRLAFTSDGTAIYKPVTGGSPTYQGSGGGGGGGAAGGTGDGASAPAMSPHVLNMNMGEPPKRKRGRPRKYGPDGTMALALAPVVSPGSGGFSPPPVSMAANPVSSPSASMAAAAAMKKARGRPPGSGKKQQMAALGILNLHLFVASFSLLLLL